MAEDKYASFQRRLDFHSERLNELDKRTSAYQAMQVDIGEIKKIMTSIQGDGNGIIGHGEQIRDNKTAIAEIQKSMNKITDVIGPVVMFYKVGVWAASILGVSILALIWALITGQVDLLFK